MSGISCRMETDEREGCSLKKWNCKGMFIALLLAFSALLPGHASAEDLWVYQGPDGVDYYLMTETIEYTDHWYADVKFVRDGEMKFLARFRFIPTGLQLTCGGGHRGNGLKWDARRKTHWLPHSGWTEYRPSSMKARKTRTTILVMMMVTMVTMMIAMMMMTKLTGNEVFF